MSAKSVLISGAGIAGATLAYWLHSFGFRPTLVERAPVFRSGGYIIDFWGNGYDVAERMGILEELQRNGYKVKEVRLVDARNRRVGGFNADVFRRITEGQYLSIARGDLAGAIYRQIEGRVETVFGDTKAAERFAGSFAPKTSFGLFLRNEITRTFSIPLVANLVLGSIVKDQKILDAYQ